MTAIEIVQRRVGMSADDAGFYVDLAAADVRAYLHLNNSADISPYESAIAKIATLYWQQDQAAASASKSGYYGVASESFSEGGVSTSHTLIDASTSQTNYDNAVAEILAGLTTGGGKTGFKFL